MSILWCADLKSATAKNGKNALEWDANPMLDALNDGANKSSRMQW
jgi:hypothetical protein